MEKTYFCFYYVCLYICVCTCVFMREVPTEARRGCWVPSTTLDVLNLGMVALDSYTSTRMGLKESDGLEEEDRDCSWPQLDRGMAAGVKWWHGPE